MSIGTGTKAFENDVHAEIVRILRAVADRIEGGDAYDMFRNIHDANGEVVGVFARKDAC